MPNETNVHHWIVNFIWRIADEVLRDVYVRGKYRDVILPMTVLRRLDSLLEPTKDAVLRSKADLDAANVIDQEETLRQAAGQTYYNTSPFTLRSLDNHGGEQQLWMNFEAYLEGFSPNVQDILEHFEFRTQIRRLAKASVLGALIKKFLSPDINLSPEPVHNADGSIKLPGLDNHAMGTIFEELIHRFNEGNNEETGEHWTPRDAVELMSHLIFLPIANQIESRTYSLYDGACGTGGMLTVGAETLTRLAQARGRQVVTHLYGQEINAEAYAIAKADQLLRGNGEVVEHIAGGPEHSTLANDAFPKHEFDFMLCNPPFGKNWKNDLERMGDKTGVKDPRFVFQYGGETNYSLVTRSTDGQLMFLANMLSKMNHESNLGSRLAAVHNGSALYIGDAGQGESNIRRWILENDWLEAIVALPSNMFYNTSIPTYIWVLTNRKGENRKGKVHLIDATQWFTRLRKSLGQKSCELAGGDIRRICDTLLAFEEAEHSKILPTSTFGYWKVTVERPLRIQGAKPGHLYSPKEIKALREQGERHENAPAVIKRIHPKSKVTANPLHGLFPATIRGRTCVVEYEADVALRDVEHIPLLRQGAIPAFMHDEVLPYAADAWYDPRSVTLGYEINFAQHFYKPPRMRTLGEIRVEMQKAALEAEQLMREIVNGHIP
ncbi:MAG TPA: class I SAM-dependent DNA methyltransferase [Polyangium sp.]|nr:class I SAM-dependent DNA methyltransferase [Polyangium sp.]